MRAASRALCDYYRKGKRKTDTMKKWFWIAVLLTVVIRGVIFLYFRPWSAAYEIQMLGEDPYVYHQLAVDLLRTGQYGGNPEYDSSHHVATVRPPGYPLFLAAVYAVFGAHPWVVLLIHVLLSAASTALLIGAVRTSFPEKTAITAGMLFAVHPVAAFTAVSLYSETFFLFLLCLLLYVMTTAQRRLQSGAAPALAIALWGATGLLAGLSTVVRVSMLYFSPLLLLLWTLVLPSPVRQRFACLLVALASFALPLVPWSLHNYQRYGSYRLSASGEYNLLVLTVGQAFAGEGLEEFVRVKHELSQEALQRMKQDGLQPATQPLHRAKYYRALALEKIRQHPLTVLLGMMRGMAKFWILPSRASGESLLSGTRGATRLLFAGAWIYAVLLQVLLAGCAVYGARLLWRQPQHLWVITFLLAALYFTLSAGAAGSSRYFLQVLPFLLPVAAHALANWSTRRARR